MEGPGLGQYTMKSATASDDAKALLSSNATIVYSKVSFRCAGKTPTTGQNK